MMGVDTRRPPLPAPTEDPYNMDNHTDVATDISRRTDRTSYSIPEDGSPITISTTKLVDIDDGKTVHRRQKSQTSLLIEYFEASKTGDKSRARPSVRVKVTPSAARKARSGSEAVQITGIGKDRKPSYTRRISLGNRAESSEHAPMEGTDITRSDESTVSRPPVEVEVLDPNSSDLSASKLSRDLRYTEQTSDLSSVPPDSFLDRSAVNTATSAAVMNTKAQHSRNNSTEYQDQTDTTHLDAPSQSRARSLSRERITQKVMEKLAGRSTDSTARKTRVLEYEPDTKPTKDRRRRGSRSQHHEELASPASSQLSSNVAASQASYRSGGSKVSLNNPKLLEMVEDTVKRLILPELHQMRKEQKKSRNLQDFDEERHESSRDRHSYHESFSKSVSKSTSTPNISGKPKVVLNRYDDDPGQVLSRGDSERRTSRRHSRESVSKDERRSSRAEVSDEDGNEKRKSSHGLRDTALGLLAGGALAAAALDKKDDSGTRSWSRKSRNDSITESADSKRETHDEEHSATIRGAHFEDEHDLSHHRNSKSSSTSSYLKDHARSQMRLPFADAPTESDLTRASIMSASSEGLHRDKSITTQQGPMRMVDAAIPAPGDFTYNANPTVSRSKDPHFLSEAAAGLAGVALAHHSSRDDYREPLVPQTAVSRTSISLGARSEKESPSPTGSVRIQSRSKGSPLMPTAYDLSAQDLEREVVSELHNDGSPAHSRARNHEEPLPRPKNVNKADQYLTDEEKRLTDYTADSMSTTGTDGNYTTHDIQQVPTSPPYILHPAGIESAVASLIDPSAVDSRESFQISEYDHQVNQQGDIVHESLHELDRSSPQVHSIEAARAVPIIPQRQGNVHGLSNWRSQQSHQIPSHQDTYRERIGDTGSPPIEQGSGSSKHDRISHELGQETRSSPSRDRISRRSQSQSGPSEEASLYYKDRAQSVPLVSELLTNKENKKTPEQNTRAALELAAGAFAAAAALQATKASTDETRSRDSKSASPPRRTTVEDYNERSDSQQASLRQSNNTRISTPPDTQVHNDEGYDSAARSVDTPKSRPNAFTQSFTGDRGQNSHSADASGNSLHIDKTRNLVQDTRSQESPFFDSTASEGMDRIHSGDVVALMEHLTVRDGQRNARDTEILMTLVRSAAEMRQNFEELRRFIADQDRAIMKNSDRNAETTQRVVSGKTARESNQLETRTPRSSSDGDSQRRPNVFKRALKGLSGRNSNDLARMEDMLERLLDDVEILKEAQLDKADGRSFPQEHSGGSITSYEALRARELSEDYELDRLRDDDTTPTQLRQSKPSPRSKQVYHSGYDGRRDSITRVSTVIEGDEESNLGRDEQLTPRPLQDQKHASPRIDERRRGMMFTETPPLYHHTRHDSAEDGSARKHRKHKSTGSSTLSDTPRVSRWSKTTTSSGEDTGEMNQEQRRVSYMSLSDGSLHDDYHDECYPNGSRHHDENQTHDAQDVDEHSLRSYRSNPSRRSASPLIPSEALVSSHRGSADRLQPPPGDLDIDDPQYQAVRKSLILEHPQPRQGTTDRHQSNLESKAQDFDPATRSLTGSDLSTRTADSDFDPSQWGSNPALSLSRAQKLGRINPLMHASPGNSPEASSPRSNRARLDDGPLVPVQKTIPNSQTRDEEPEAGQQPSQAAPRSYDRHYYNSPLGSGHLLEPIEEVRYSLETDRGHVSPVRHATPEQSPKLSRARVARKITGPRPMVGKEKAL